MPEWRCSVLYQRKKSRQTARASAIEAKRSGRSGRGEAVGEAGPILERLELSLRVGVVVGDVGPRVGLGDAEVSEQERDRLRGHRTAPVRVDDELPGRYALLGERLSNQALSEGGLLAVGDHPADDVAAVDIEDVDIEDDVQIVVVVVGPLGWPEQLGDVPAPDLLGRLGAVASNSGLA